MDNLDQLEGKILMTPDRVKEMDAAFRNAGDYLASAIIRRQFPFLFDDQSSK